MKARDIMTTSVVTVGPEAVVSDVAELLVSHHISAVPVVDGSGALVGMISESDFLRRVEGRPSGRWWLRLLTSAATDAQEYVKAHGRKVGEVMSRDVVTIGPDASLGEVAHTLETQRVKRLPVVDGGHVIGVVSRADIVRALAARRTDTLPTPTHTDSEIRAAVVAAIADFDWATSARVSVTVTNGEVAVYGGVDHEAQREALKVAAENVPGVTKVEVYARPWPAWAYAD